MHVKIIITCYYIRKTRHNKNDDVYNINLRDDEEKSTSTWIHPIQKKELYVNYFPVNILERLS
jgi:hypothetical protein